MNLAGDEWQRYISRLADSNVARKIRHIEHVDMDQVPASQRNISPMRWNVGRQLLNSIIRLLRSLILAENQARKTKKEGQEIDRLRIDTTPAPYFFENHRNKRPRNEYELYSAYLSTTEIHFVSRKSTNVGRFGKISIRENLFFHFNFFKPASRRSRMPLRTPAGRCSKGRSGCQVSLNDEQKSIAGDV